MSATSKFRLIAINLAVLCLMLVAVELIASLSMNSRKDDQTSQGDSDQLLTWHFELHPGVGHAHTAQDYKDSPNAKNSISKNVLYTEKEYNIEKPTEATTFLVLGGSTTDPLGTRFSGILGTWPDQLADLLKRNKKGFRIINAGAGASTSSQELLRLATIQQSRKIDLTLSLNGINEIYFARPEYKDDDKLLASSMVLNGIASGKLKADGQHFYSDILHAIGDRLRSTSTSILIDRIKRNTLAKRPDSVRDSKKASKHRSSNHAYNLSAVQKSALSRAAKTWEGNMHMMQAASEAMGSDYLVFLQPTYGLDMNSRELAGAKESAPANSSVARKTTNQYLAEINHLYGELRKRCGTLPYCVDLSRDKTLTSDESLYRDSRHFNASGNAHLARLIHQRIKDFNRTSRSSNQSHHPE